VLFFNKLPLLLFFTGSLKKKSLRDICIPQSTEKELDFLARGLLDVEIVLFSFYLVSLPFDKFRQVALDDRIGAFVIYR